jgi:capsid portal protein
MKETMHKDNSNEYGFMAMSFGHAEAVPQPTEILNKAKGFVQFGDDNMYPQFLYSCYSGCSLLKSIVDGMVDYISGSGFVNDTTNTMQCNRKGETWEELVKKATADYIIFGAFCLQLIRNRAGQIVELYHVDTRFVRLSEDENFVYYSKKWDSYRVNPKRYVRWRRGIADTNSMFYYKNPRSRELYGIPNWSSAIEDVQTSMEIKHYHLNAINNNFCPSAVMSFHNGIPTPNEKKELEKKVNEKFSGSTNAARLLMNFANDKEHGVEVSRLSEDNFDQRYNALSQSVKQNIFVAFRAQPMLFGADTDRTGFNAVEYENSFKLYQATVVAPKQREIEKAFAIIDGKKDDNGNIVPLFSFQLKEFAIAFNGSTDTTNNI